MLFSNDAFGEHLATSERFDDEVDAGVLAHETTKYYVNILTLYSQQVRNLLAKVCQAPDSFQGFYAFGNRR